ncbi:hypothetical protein ACFPIJ_31300 [Dactylosporangium cerinum]|uniref:Uncharacterized protein n=1 Tax=Dactylosporangium cerinum TaxID=1434730 RepID=A0ABV9W0Z5_9ACTN
MERVVRRHRAAHLGEFRRAQAAVVADKSGPVVPAVRGDRDIPDAGSP